MINNDTENDIKKSFLILAKELQKYCGKVSPEKCRKGKCPFTHKTYGCFTEALGMNSPYDWEMEADNEH